MDVKPISVAAIKPSVDSGGRERSPQQFGGGKHKLDAQADNSSDDVAGEQPAQDGQMPDGIAEDALLIDAPDLAPELPTAPRPGRYINKVV
jgi:hypothetical protein